MKESSAPVSSLRSTSGVSIPLLGVAIRATVTGGFTESTVIQRYRNSEEKPLEAIYTFPLPSTGVLTGFTMTAGGRRVTSVLKEREEAFRTYDDALQAGHGAALLEEERPNVFTASVGNLLPGEETVLEISWLSRTETEEGVLRLSVPTLVAPRYVPGTPQGHRTAGGFAEPTDRVPDADRITPPADPSGTVPYGVSIDVLFDLARPLRVSSPSHTLSLQGEGGNRVRATLRFGEAALDRDLVLLAEPTDRRVEDTFGWHALSLHREAGGDGYFAFTFVPDLAASARPAPLDVVFVVDTSGSMEGDSIREAKTALRLSLRQLRAGDRFQILEFNSTFSAFAGGLVPFDDRSLVAADTFVSGLSANGGTELREPLVTATRLAPDGLVVLLTDGQVSNEAEILAAVLSARKTARIATFGIGTNVSDVLLRDLAKKTGGALTLIHPGERVDEKVLAQFAAATAPRLSNVAFSVRGANVFELAPATPPAVVDGTPFSIFGRVTGQGPAEVEIKGTLGRETVSLSLPVFFLGEARCPAVAKLWAKERIHELEGADVSARREESNRQRIVSLSLAHGVASSLTAFVAVEEREGARRTSQQAETRVVPVAAPAGWGMFRRQRNALTHTGGFAAPAAAAVSAASFGAAAAMAGAAPPPPPSPAQFSPSPAKSKRAMRPAGGRASLFDRDSFAEGASSYPSAEQMAEEAPAQTPQFASGSPESILAKQLASGLFPGEGAGSDSVRTLRGTAAALLALHRLGVDASHAVHGALVRKAVDALLALDATVWAEDAAATRAALAAALLVATGPRTRTRLLTVAGSVA
ncbi:MAG: VWA domain-containing protein, partial [Acidobacteria bacterium]|nr:VWA domain-containing protein [Acidobacteriota bacterium]